jgi:hypothetical protein
VNLQMSDQLAEQVLEERDAYRKNLIVLVSERDHVQAVVARVKEIEGDLSDIRVTAEQLPPSPQVTKIMQIVESCLSWIRSH